jgi:hypothetical protein
MKVTLAVQKTALHFLQFIRTSYIYMRHTTRIITGRHKILGQKYNSVQYRTIQYNIIRYSTVQ